MILAILLLLTVWSANVLALDDVLEKYTYVKAMARCLGEDSYYNFLSQVNNAKRECSFLDYRDLERNISSNSVSTFLETFLPNPFGNRPQYFGTNNNNNNFNSYNNFLQYNDVLNYFSSDSPRTSRLTVNPSDSGRPYRINNNRYGANDDSSHIIVANDDQVGSTVRPVQYDGSQGRPVQYDGNQGRPVYFNNDPYSSNVDYGYPQVIPQRRSDSRSYTYDSEFISEAIYSLRSAILNFTCVLQRLDMIDSNYNINYQTVLNTFIERNVLDYRLRQDLSDGVNLCRQSMRCIRSTSLPIPVELYRLLEFMKCEKRTRLTSCFRQDLRQNLHLFDLSALPEDKGRRAYLENLMAVVMGTDLLEGSEFL